MSFQPAVSRSLLILVPVWVKAGSVSSKVSQRDLRVTSSMADSLFDKLSVFDKDVMSNVLYKKFSRLSSR